MIRHSQIFWSILNPRQRKLFFIILFINMAIALMEVASLGALFPIIFSLLSPDSINTIPVVKDFLDKYAPVRGREFIILALVITSIAIVLKNILFGAFIWFKSYYVEKIAADLSQKLFLKYMTAPYIRHIQRNTGEIVRNLTDNISIFKGSFLNILLEFFTHSSIGIAYLIFLTFIDPTLMTYFISVMAIIMLIITYFLRKKSRVLGQSYADYTKNRNHFILLGLIGFKEIKVLIKESFFLKKFNELAHNLKFVGAKTSFFQNMPKLIIETAVVILAITAIIILFVQSQSPPNIIAKLGVFAFAAIKVLPIIIFFSSSFSTLSYGSISLEIIQKELADGEISDIPDLESNFSSSSFVKTIELKNIFFQFHTKELGEKNVINGINLTIKKNSVIGLVGESGSGKTTLVDIIIGLLHPHKGEILIDSKPLTQPGIWSHKIGYIPQQIYLTNASVKENIALGWPKDDIDEKRVWEVLEIAQMAEIVKSLPEGIDTEIGESGVKLSGGQKQRVGIARALYHKPDLLILDEATSALDNRTEMDFVNRLQELNISATQIIIAHRLSTVKHCDLIYVLNNGHIVEKGTYLQLEKKGSYFRKMLLKDIKKKPAKPKKTN